MSGSFIEVLFEPKNFSGLSRNAPLELNAAVC